MAALRKALAKCLLTGTPKDSSLVLSKNSAIPNAAKAEFRREFFTSSDSLATGFLRRFLQRRAINSHSSPTSFLTLPVGDKLRDKIKSLNVAGDHRLTINWMNSPPPPLPREESDKFVVKIKDAKKMLRFVQLEKVKQRLRNIPENTIPYGEFVRICGDVCGNEEHGLEFSRALDDSGEVIVLGAVVFLRPDQVAKSMEKLISQSIIAMPNDPRRKELAHLEKKKSIIDQKAHCLVQRELYFGLGFLVLQTLGFMRLTFWELSWDVMEPICFFVTSAHFAIAYAFFLRTSQEPSFNGYFRSRFKVKQKKLMRIYNFDLERYKELCEAFYCNNIYKK
ncbi:calcium uniporter protein 4, mitochondrial-like [Olea europaea var. sylvestris]|uniref:calcium uniporter protein 4, mitochondrial-like n=1 Tax=Olea europaea var. sylvestris TaxID=158386 RepID=UPI000C1CE09B|nr:calcium uniporter protein 4, mitochondrial-like [Olea europaea var. sylvestris]